MIASLNPVAPVRVELPPPAAESEVEVSVVIPCLNEARTVGRCIDKALGSFRELGVAGEVVVADNGSTDGSVEIARAHGARVVSAARRGYGSALQAGIAGAKGPFVVMGDADDSYDFSRLSPFVERLRAGDELVVGNRFRGGIRPGAMPWLHKYVGNPVLSGFLNLLYRTPIADAHCGLRAFRRDAYARWGLRCSGMEFASEMVVKATLHRARISEVPTVLHPDGRDRPPHLRSFRDGWRHLRLLLVLCPSYLYLVPALLLLALGGAGAAYAALAEPGATGRWVALGAGLALVLGCQAFWLWAFATVFGSSSGLLPRDAGPRRLLRYATLEPALVCGLALVTVGAAVALARAFGAGIDPDHAAWWGFVILTVGGQTILNGFALFMIRVSRADEMP